MAVLAIVVFSTNLFIDSCILTILKTKQKPGEMAALNYLRNAFSGINIISRSTNPRMLFGNAFQSIHETVKKGWTRVPLNRA